MTDYKWSNDETEFALKHEILDVYELREICLNLLGRIKELEADEEFNEVLEQLNPTVSEYVKETRGGVR